MNYEQARQIDPKSKAPDAGKWRWTNMRDHKVWAAGGCLVKVSNRPCSSCNGKGEEAPNVVCLDCSNTGLEGVYEPCPGHDTETEAQQHNWEYEIATAMLPGRFKATVPRKCAKCGRYTVEMAQIDDYTMYPLCKRHMNAETLRLVHRVSGGNIHS